MAFEYAKLRGRIVEKYGSQAEFAKKLGISEVSVSRKMNCVVSFSRDDIVQWCDLLGIDQSEIGVYFFT